MVNLRADPMGSDLMVKLRAHLISSLVPIQVILGHCYLLFFGTCYSPIVRVPDFHSILTLPSPIVNEILQELGLLASINPGVNGKGVRSLSARIAVVVLAL